MHLFAAKVGKRDAVIAPRDADEKQVVVLPGWQPGVMAPVGDQAAKDFPQKATMNTVIIELDQKDAPGLGSCHVTQLTNYAAGKDTGVMLGHTESIG
jgi:hypothetical protein